MKNKYKSYLSVLVCLVMFTFAQKAKSQVTISSFSPVSGPVGTSVTITGTNFDPVAANNIVFFGATMGTVTAASTTSLTVTVNSGSTNQPVSVLNGTTKSIGYSSKSFINTFTPNTGRLTVDDFEAPVNLAGLSPKKIVICDLNSDGKPDLIVSNAGYYGNSNNTISVFRNISSSGTITSGSFAARVDFQTTSNPNFLVVGDLDGDGKPDIAVANNINGIVTILKNNSTGNTISLSIVADLNFGTNQVLGLDIADIDGDGKLDLITGGIGFANSTSFGILVVRRNIGLPGVLDGNSFAAGVSFSHTNYPSQVVARDLDGDGRPDLIAPVANGLDRVVVMRNISTPGNVNFEGAQYLDPSGSCYRVAVGDIDGDGKPEIVTANLNYKTISVFRNTSTTGISFAGTQNFYASEFPIDVAIADINGDGKLDVFATDNYVGLVSVFKNSSTIGAISLNSKINITGNYAESIAIGDIDGDGKPDLVTANNKEQNQGSGSLTLSVLRNRPIFPPTVQVSNLSASSILGKSTKFSWTNGNGTSRAVFVKLGSTGAAAPIDNTIYTAATFGLGTQIDNTGWYCVYNGTGSSTTVGGLNISTAYRTMVVEYTGTPGNEQYITTVTSNIINTTTTAEQAPVITAFSPVSGVVGTTVTITGSNFSNTAANNIVFFGSTMATVTASTATTLTVTVPVGATYKPISVLNGETHLIAYSKAPFVITFTPGRDRISNDDFTDKTNITIAGIPNQVVLADLDGDGKADLIVGSNTDVTVFRNIAAIGVLNASSFDTPKKLNNGSISALAVGDLDGDGKPDLVIAEGTSISIYKNTSSTGVVNFNTKVSFSLGSQVANIVISDLDGDGKPDLMLSSSTGTASLLNIYHNITSNGVINTDSFEPAILLYSTSNLLKALVVRDLDGDGKPDIGVADANSANFLLFHNNAVSGVLNTSSFSMFTYPVSSSNLTDVVSADVNNDGKPELFIGSQNNVIVVLRNATTVGANFTAASFVSETSIPTYASSNLQRLEITDLNGDGKLDLVSVNAGTNNLTAYLNTTSTAISFVRDGNYSTGTSPFQVAIGDIDGDGKPDLVATNQSSSSITIYRNNPQFAPTLQATGLTFSATSSTRTTLSWTNGNGIARAVFVKQASTGSVLPVDNNSYTANLAFGLGAQVGSTEWYCIYNGTASTTTVNSLKELTDYQVMVVEYNGTAGNELYLTTSAPGNLGTFTTPATITPTVQATAVTATVNYTTSTIAWTNGNGENRAVFIMQATSGTPIPADQVTYTANPAVGVGTQIGTTGWYCVYNGAGNTVNVTGLSKNSNYQIMVVEYNGSLSNERYLTTIATGNPINLATIFVPTIASFAPASGVAGTSVTITGTGFNTVAANNIVFFGGAKGTVTTATATSLTVTVPVGATYKPITVTNADNKLTASSRLPFTVTFAGKGTMTENDFDAKINIATNGAVTTPATFGVALGDLDGDGKLDVVVANSGAAANGFGISIYKNNATSGTLATANFVKQDLNTPTAAPKNVYIQDLNGDGKPEIILSYTSARVSIFPNTSPGDGSITFGSPINLTTGNVPLGISFGDIDGDGRIDIAVANSSVSSVSLFKNTYTNSTLSFNAQVLITTGITTPQYVELKDLNGDDKPDLIVTSATSGNILVLKNNALTDDVFRTTSFSTIVITSGLGQPGALVVADLDGDGVNDLVVGSLNSTNYGIYKNNTVAGENLLAANFTGLIKATAVNYIPSIITLGDLDGDGKVDLLTGYSTGATNNVAVLKNNTTSGAFSATSFATQFNLPVGAQIGAIAVGDLDGDGKPDIAITNRSTIATNGLILIRNNPILAPTTQATAVVVSNLRRTTATLSWTNGNGAARTVFMKAVNSGTPLPVNLTDYAANAVFGTGAQIGVTGWYAVYNGTASTVNVSGLTMNTNYQVMVLEYNGTSAMANYQTATATDNPVNITTTAIDITSFAPTAAAAGETVTLTGSNFTNASTVTFGGREATFTVVSDTELTTVVAAGSASGSVAVTGPDGSGSLAGFTFNTPTITAGTVSGTISACFGTAGADPNLQQFTIAGTWLTAGITATAPTGFEISKTATSGFGTTVTLNPTAGAVTTTTIYVRAAASAVAGAITGNIRLTTTDGTTQNVAVSGTVYAIPTANAITNIVINNGDSYPLTFTGTGADTFTWEHDNDAIGLPTGPGQGNIGAGVIYENTTNAPIVAHFTITPSNTVSGCTGTPVTFTLTVLPDPTTIASIEKVSTAITNATNVSYTVTFVEVVTGVTASNFAVAASGITGSTITGITGSGKTYTVTVNTGSGSGTLGLNLANATGISRAITTTLPFVGEVYTLDKTAPAVPTNLVATRGDSKITLSWNANTESDLATYKIYSGTSTNPTTLLTTIIAPATLYIHTGLTNGTLYYYRITSVDALGNESAYSTEDSGIPKASQTINFGTLANKTYGNADFNPGATSATTATNVITYTSSNTAVATIVNNQIHIVGVGTTNITAKQGGSTSYNAATDVVQSFTVTASSQTITFGALANKTFGDASFSLTATGGASGNPVTYTSSNLNVATISGNTVTIVGVGLSTITANQLGNSNYTAAAPVEQDLSVVEKGQTITFGALANKTFGDASFNLIATGGASGNPVTYTSSNLNVATISGNTVTIVGAGSTVITAVQAGNASYTAAAQVTQDLIVNKADQVITYSTFASKILETTDFEPGATVNTGLALTYTSSNTGVATVYQDILDGNKWKIHLVAEGVTDITAVQAGNVNYNAKTMARTLTVAGSVLPVTLLNYIAKADGNRAKMAWTTSSEHNNDRFEIERSVDGANFTHLSSVKGNGTTTNSNTYTVYDNNPVNGANYYRLKQYDLNGKIALLGDRVVNFKIEETIHVKAYPNPTTDEVNLLFSNYNGSEAKVIITDLTGRTIHNQLLRLIPGTTSYKLNLVNKLVPGQYIINVTGIGLKTNIKLIAVY